MQHNVLSERFPSVLWFLEFHHTEFDGLLPAMLSDGKKLRNRMIWRSRGIQIKFSGNEKCEISQISTLAVPFGYILVENVRQ